MRHPRRTLPRPALVRRLWGAAGGAGDLNALRIQVSRLRRKITSPYRAAPLIRSVRGVGYEFTENVLELGAQAGGGPSDPAAPALPRSVLEVARGLITRPGTAGAAAFLTEALVGTVGCDAAAVFRLRAHRLELVAERGNTERWRSVIGVGVPLRSTFAQVDAIETRQPTQVADIQGGPYRYTETARALADDGFHSCLFVPIVSATGTWGGLGLASRSRRPFDPAATTFCVAAAAMFSLAVPSAR
jgi:transcriptional regulator with GAF, ATPase, and Fis domain